MERVQQTGEDKEKKEKRLPSEAKGKGRERARAKQGARGEKNLIIEKPRIRTGSKLNFVKGRGKILGGVEHWKRQSTNMKSGRTRG